jgi:hypothetical protein
MFNKLEQLLTWHHKIEEDENVPTWSTKQEAIDAIRQLIALKMAEL